jgi:hypothetical protein
MKKLFLLALPLIALSFALAPVAQKRVTPKGEADFPSTLDSARAAWEAKDYATCVSSLKDALTLATAERAKTIRAALPAAPQGYERQKPANQDQGNAMMAAMGMAIGNIVEQVYKQTDSSQRIQVTVTADSPMVGMLGMAFGNPAMLGENSELIEYNEHKAVLKTEGSRLNLQVLIWDKHVVDVQCPEDEEFLFRMFDQEAIDKIAAALGK